MVNIGKTALILALVVCSCTSGSPPNGEVKTTVAGTAYFNGLMPNARVEIFDFKGGVKGLKWAETTTDQQGAWNVELGSKYGDILVVATSDQGTVSALSAGVEAGANVEGIVVNPVTSLSVVYAAYLVRINRFADLSPALDKADELLFKHFGTVAPDTIPVDPSADVSHHNDGIILGILIASLETRAREMSPSATLGDLLGLLEEDLDEDGYFDGQGLRQLTLGNTNLSGDTLRPEYGSAIAQFLGSADNGTHFKASDITDIIDFVNTDECALFRGPASPPDRNPPVLDILAPSNGSVVAGSVKVQATATDAEGNLDRIEAVAPAGLSGTYQDGAFQGMLDTSKLPEGPLTITLGATDKAGNRDERSIQVTVENQGKIVGFVFKGFVKQAQVTAYQFDPNGTPPILARAITGDDGSYSFDMAGYSGPVLLVATSGAYAEEALGQEVEFAQANYLSAVIPSYSPAFRGNVTLSPLTTWAADFAGWRVGSKYEDPSTAADKANTAISQLFGGLDILGTVPVDLLAGQECTTITDRVLYSLYAAGLSQMAMQISNDSGLTPGAVVNAISLTDAISLDVKSDGVFDGRQGPKQLQQGNYNLSGYTMRAELARAVIDWIKSPRNTCSFKGTDFVQYADALSGFDSDFIDGPGKTWDNVPPEIQLVSPADGASVHGMVSVTAKAADWSGIKRFVVVDPAGVVDIEPAVDRIGFQINADGFTDTLNLVFEAEDKVGNVGRSTFKLLVDNAGPEIVFSPASGGFTNQVTFGFTGTCTDPAGVASLSINGVPALVGEGGAFTSQALSLVDGTNCFPVVTADSLGNTTSVSYEVVLDRVQPAIYVQAPLADQTFIYGQNIDVAAAATDASRIRSLTVSAAGVLLQDTDPSPGTVAATIRAADYPVGQLELDFAAEDLAGNQADRKVTVNIVQSISFDGKAIKGPVSGGKVWAYDWSAGNKGTAVGDQAANTGSDGSFTISVGPHDSLVLFEMTGGQYKEEARDNYDLPVTLPPTTFRMWSIAGDGQTVMINPFSTLATILAENRVASGDLPIDGKSNAWRRIEAIFGFPLVTVPLNCREQQATGFNDSARAGLLLAGLSWLGSHYYGDFNASEVLIKVFEDFEADGLLDGKGFGGLQLSLGQYNLDANVLRATLGRGVVNFLDSTYNQTGLVSSNPDIQAWLAGIAGNNDPIFDPKQPPMPVDTVAPVIAFGTQTQGQPVRQTIHVEATATDNQELAQFDLVAPTGLVHTTTIVDNKTRRISFDYNTTQVPDGPFNVVYRATDTSNNVTEATLSLLVDNTAPTITWTTPANNSFQSSRQVNFGGTFADTGSGIAYIRVNGKDATRTGSNWSLTISETSDGQKQYSLLAADLAGNLVTLQRSVTIDTTAPTMSLNGVQWQSDRKFYQSANGGTEITVTLSDAYFASGPSLIKIREMLGYSGASDITAHNLPVFDLNLSDNVTPVAQLTVQYRYSLNGGAWSSWAAVPFVNGGFKLPISTAISSSIGNCVLADTHKVQIQVLDQAQNAASKTYSFHVALIPAQVLIQQDTDFADNAQDPDNVYQLTTMDSCSSTDPAYPTVTYSCTNEPADHVFDDHGDHPQGLHFAHLTITNSGQYDVQMQAPDAVTGSSAQFWMTKSNRLLSANDPLVFSGNYCTPSLFNSCNGPNIGIGSGVGNYQCMPYLNYMSQVDDAMAALPVSIDLREDTVAGNIVVPNGGYYTLQAGKTYHMFFSLPSIPAAYHRGPDRDVKLPIGAPTAKRRYVYWGYNDPDPTIFGFRCYYNSSQNKSYVEGYNQVLDMEYGWKFQHDLASFNFNIRRAELAAATYTPAVVGYLDNHALGAHALPDFLVSGTSQIP